MAVDKLVDSTQLNADLTSVANAIRTKGGTSAPLSFPYEFVSAVNDIPTGSGISIDTWATSGPVGEVTITATSVRSHAFESCDQITGAQLPNALKIGVGSFSNTGIEFFYAPLLETVEYSSFSTTKLKTIAFPSIKTLGVQYVFNSCKNLTAVDFGPHLANIPIVTFNGCTVLKTVILRTASIVTMSNINAFGGSPYANGGSGGTIYIPKSLYDHLGDGTALDYKAATNWSTLDGYGTITWAQIEGSIYETQYADGTPIT